MKPKISRRYDALVRFLRDTMTNESITHRIRFQAAERLSEIYARHDEAAEKAAARKHRFDTKALITQEQQEGTEASQTPTQDHEQEQLTTQADIQRFLDSIQKPEPSTDAAAE
jgi:hypothetical protein